MRRYWTLQLAMQDEHCLRLSHPHGAQLRCWHGQQAYAMLGSRNARELLPVERLLRGDTARLAKSEVSELLLLAARIAMELEIHARLRGSPVRNTYRVSPPD